MNKPVNEITFHLINEGMPEDIQPVLWWYKGIGCPPYCGSMSDTDFPNIDFFFAWCEIPNPSIEFWEKYNTRPHAEVDLKKENLKLHIQIHQLQEQVEKQERYMQVLLTQLGEVQQENCEVLHLLVYPDKKVGGMSITCAEHLECISEGDNLPDAMRGLAATIEMKLHCEAEKREKNEEGEQPNQPQ